MTLLLAAVLGLGTAAVAGAQEAPDQHSGGDDVLDEGEDRSPPDTVAGTTDEPGASSLPVTGGDVAGVLALASVAVIGGGALLAVSRRRPARP